jgi:threonyl-tRNA synthetase
MTHIFLYTSNWMKRFKKVIDLVLYVFGSWDLTAQISLRDKENRDKYIGTDENWRKLKMQLSTLQQIKDLILLLNMAKLLSGPKLTFMVKDALGRQWQLGTIQVDFNTVFDLTYKGSDNELHRPVMIQSAIWIYGTLYSIFLEHTAGNFPLWLMPEQAIILSLSEKYEICQKVLDLLENHEIRGLIDNRSETIGKKSGMQRCKNPIYADCGGEEEEKMAHLYT